MALKKYKPRSCGMRFRESATFEEITEKRPVKRLTKAVRKTAGRNNQGRITTRHHGGGAKQRMRIVDFKRNKFDVEATVKDIAYDPTRSAYLALIEYTDGVKSYILAPEGLKPGMKVMNGAKAEATVGNCLPLSQIPLGLFVHAVELVPGRGAAVASFNGRCLATVGSVGNKDWGSIKLGKAGRKRYLGIRPTVRGVAMNPVDHPMGGGEGRTSGGSNPRSPWGKLAKGGKTRPKRKASNKIIVKRRK